MNKSGTKKVDVSTDIHRADKSTIHLVDICMADISTDIRTWQIICQTDVDIWGRSASITSIPRPDHETC